MYEGMGRNLSYEIRGLKKVLIVSSCMIADRCMRSLTKPVCRIPNPKWGQTGRQDAGVQVKLVEVGLQRSYL